MGNCDYATCEFDESDVVKQEDFYPDVPRYWFGLHVFALQCCQAPATRKKSFKVLWFQADM